ncbi:hypothetical protein RKE25_11805 [Dyella sp. BiH032]|uniref:hypothetical protein n=1 Tax=Dyella sp. BiH032 TaxID=3075430 RepID=UPI002892EFEB|nr:hypothetical protein [Dyella sp. BiH032]WNL44115.1 hypothetical protein RKE25_11805 [Dyella sp. BiH032]
MGLNLYDGRGCALVDQRMSWRDMVQTPISKLEDDAFTRVRAILMEGDPDERDPDERAGDGSAALRPCLCAHGRPSAW